ncbi:hypothetical protein GCM10010350_29190 [Streptomyces galilaeus]|nr:hypothetical protein GCM10010350_29190 [Streptomyces galilaeus]
MGWAAAAPTGFEPADEYGQARPIPSNVTGRVSPATVRWAALPRRHGLRGRATPVRSPYSRTNSTPPDRT